MPGKCQGSLNRFKKISKTNIRISLNYVNTVMVKLLNGIIIDNGKCIHHVSIAEEKAVLYILISQNID